MTQSQNDGFLFPIAIAKVEGKNLVIKGEHSCMTARGIKKPGTVTKTACIHGKFKKDIALRQEFYDLIS